MEPDSVKALIFDVFATVVDWRSSITREGQALGKQKGLNIDWEAFADDWRSLYDPAIARIRDGSRDFVNLDVLHRENLLEMLDRTGINGLSKAKILMQDTILTTWRTILKTSPANLVVERKSRFVSNINVYN